MASAPPLTLQILARSVEASPEGTRLRWTVDVHIDGERVLENLFLIDPLSPNQRILCRWYLEQFIQQSPYSVDLANDAENLLKFYPEDILRQLRLKEAVTPYLQELRSGRPLSIEVCDNSEPSTRPEETIYQLFWEILEDHTHWGEPLWSILVQRTIALCPQLVRNPSQVHLRRQTDGIGCTINLLLVIARDLSRNPAIYNDVNPFLASSALADIKRKLEESGSHVQLHIETVRPGTFASFEEHLRLSEEIHGPGYFHIVHFDLHGKVGTRAGTISKHGFLYFCSPDSDHTVPVPAQRVSKILTRHKVPLVILNACESARANSGDDANIAKVFQGQGIHNVLAMSFKISTSAVEIFLNALYCALLLKRCSFATSAAAARQALRLHRTRQARFGLQRQVIDSFVAVTYTCRRDSIFVISGQQTQSLAKPMNFYLGDSSATSPAFVGRDFDVLRLENLLLQSDLVYLHGLAGVGKTAFLTLASSIWQSTAIADTIVNIDFSTQKILAAEDLLDTIMRQLLCLQSEEYQSSMWTVPSLSLRSHDTDTIQAAIDDLLSKHKVVIIFDRIDIPLSTFPPPLVPGAANEFERIAIYKWIQSHLRRRLAPSASSGLYMICAARRADTVWLENLIGPKWVIRSYELRGLEMPDAMDLAHRGLRAHGEEVGQWGNEDTDWLEAIVNLLQGIPLAILHVLPLQAIFNIPWRGFFHRLHAGHISLPGDSTWLDSDICQSCSFVQELRHLHSVMVKHDIAFLLHFSNFWHEAPLPAQLRTLFMAYVGDSLKDDFLRQEDAENFGPWAASLAEFAVDRGYISIDPQMIFMRVHPLLTVYGRALAPEFISWPAKEEVAQVFLDSIQQLSLLKSARSSASLRNSEVGAKDVVVTANLFTCINLCLSEGPATFLKRWPLHLFLTFCIHKSDRLDISQEFLMTEKYYELLRAFSASLKVSGADVLQIRFFVLVLLSFYPDASHRRCWSWERCHEILDLGFDMILALERLAGPETPAEVLCWKGILLLAQALAFVETEAHEEAVERWRVAQNLMNEMLCHPGKAFIRPSSEGIKQESNLGTAVSDEAFALFREFFEHFQKQEAGYLPVENHGRSQPKQRSLETLGLAKMARECALDELEELSKCSGRDTEVILPEKNGTRYQLLDALEDAQDIGDWWQALESHRTMFEEALESCLFNEAQEHIKALRNICQKSSFLMGLPLLDNLEEAALIMRKQFMLCCSLFPSEAGFRQDMVKIYNEILDSMADIAPSQVCLCRRFLDHVAETDENGMPINPISRERWVRWVRKYGGRMYRNQSFRMYVMAAFEKFVGLSSEMYDAYKAGDFDTLLSTWNSLAELVRHELPLSDFIPEGGSAELLKHPFSEECKRLIAIRKTLVAWVEAICRDDFDTARSHIKELAQLEQMVPSDVVSADDSTDQFYLSAEMGQLQDWMQLLHEAKAGNDLTKVRRVYSQLIERYDEGDFPHIDLSEICAYRLENLAWMIHKAAQNGLWRDAIGFCDEYLGVLALNPQENATARDKCLNTRETCESSLIQESFDVAEAGLDFDKCLRLVDDWERLWHSQQQNLMRPRWSFILLSAKLLQFLRDCYRDRCVPCARWCRRREQTSCPLDEKRGRFRLQKLRSRTRHHNRATLRAPFGCQHHCRGGYCLLDSAV